MSGIDNTIKIWSTSSIQSTKYINSHKIPFTNPYSNINKKQKIKNKKIKLNDNDMKQEEDDDDNYGDIAMSELKMNDVIQENQDHLSNPPSHQIDLSTLLFW
eukprot:229525_1